jgi:hypothetical protein
MKFFRQIIVYSMIFVLPLVGMLEAAHAALIPTQQFAAATDRAELQNKVKQALSRPELASQLESMGVSPEQAWLRVDSMTSEELTRVADQADRLPAGGDIFGTIGAIFIILLITDLLGLTKVFPFTRAQR